MIRDDTIEFMEAAQTTPSYRSKSSQSESTDESLLSSPSSIQSDHLGLLQRNQCVYNDTLHSKKCEWLTVERVILPLISFHWYEYIWMNNCQSQGQTSWFICNVTKIYKLHRDHYRCLVTFCQKLNSYEVVYLLHNIDSESNKNCSVLMMFELSIGLSTGSALYCGLIADPYIHIHGSNSVRLSTVHGVSLLLRTSIISMFQ